RRPGESSARSRPSGGGVACTFTQAPKCSPWTWPAKENEITTFTEIGTTMAIDEIEQRLAAAQERRQKAQIALAPKHKGGEWEEYWSAHNAVLRLERELAAAKGEEYAIPMDFPVKWDIGAPLPHVLQNDWKAFLTFYVRVPDPGWDGIYVTI